MTVAEDVEKILSVEGELAHTRDRALGIGEDFEDFENALEIIIGNDSPVFQSIQGDIAIMMGAVQTLTQGITHLRRRLNQVAEQISGSGG